MEQLELFPELPTFRVAIRVDGQAQIYEVQAVDFEHAKRIVAKELGNANVWVRVPTVFVPAVTHSFRHTTSPERA